MMLVVEDTEVQYPRMRSQVTKSVSAATEASSTIAPMHRGLLIQLETEEQRRLWHVIYLQSSEPQTTSKDPEKDCGSSNKDAAKEDDKDAKVGHVDSKAEEKDAKEEGAVPTGESKESGKRDVTKSLSMRELDIDRCRIMTSIMPPPSAPKETAKESAHQTAQEAGKEIEDELPKQSESEHAS